MLTKIKNRLASEQGFTLIELLVVIVILGILAAIAVPSYLSFRGKAQSSAAEANVRSAIPAAESYYQTNSSYANLSSGALQAVAPGVSPHVLGEATSDGQGYCIQDSEDGGTTYYSYASGDAAMNASFNKATIEVGACSAAISNGASGGVS